MSLKKLLTMSAIGLAMSIVSASATAEGDGFVEDYVTNPYGEVWKNSFGECWRDRFAATDKKLEECGYEKPMGVSEVIVTDGVKEVVITDTPPACPDVIVLKNLHFDFDSTVVSDADKGKLEAARDFIRAEVPEGCHKPETVSVTGHTDSTGPEVYNSGLSLRRAEAVITYLRSIGTKISLVPAGKGESEPVADNSTKEGRSENRRVVIDIDTSN
ncbi:MAG: OmpA family protein [gamma proteobacterium symbiont of Lucinoma myriamae]|nr:OmpA family protein [gamma proteobacterium symbiont of Lucinoma myriamae]MCU7818017.1 OmpA family protein [gamma proteobacterium symbiont of Lucinoma myriamae]MCU7832683.1 OmpA family protein [gamma proteobacterium symbiont of Lucinoma myriamae]